MLLSNFVARRLKKPLTAVAVNFIALWRAAEFLLTVNSGALAHYQPGVFLSNGTFDETVYLLLVLRNASEFAAAAQAYGAAQTTHGKSVDSVEVNDI